MTEGSKKRTGLRLRLGRAGRIASLDSGQHVLDAPRREEVSDLTWSLVESLVGAFKGLPAVRCVTDGSVELRYEVKLSWVVITVAPSGRVNVNAVAKAEAAEKLRAAIRVTRNLEDVEAHERRLNKVDADRVGKGG